jgi:glycosyltransferase involved in cell wall biosynthesis
MLKNPSAMRLLFVVHRYAPFPGGSEIYVQAMAEESLFRGHDVTVFAGEHQGNYNGITVTSNPNVLLANWDAVVVHGGDVAVQDFVLANASHIPSPVLYLLVLPSNSPACIAALSNCRWLGCSTKADERHCRQHGVAHKAVQVRHGIRWQDCMGSPGFKQRHGIKGRMFISCGGYWPNKAMRELADLFETAGMTDATLVTTGYDNRMDLMPTPRHSILPLMVPDRREILSAMHDADCMIMHSHQEGFGLVLLESMLNQTPWIARHIAGAETLQEFGQTYRSDAELVTLLHNFDRDSYNIKAAYDHVCSNHLISHTVDDIEAAIKHGTI